MNRVALLLAGGAGTRLWPFSSDERPKQFLPLLGGKSLLRRTYERVADLEVFVSTNERYREQVLEELPELAPDRVITEPTRRNTGPAMALACLEIGRRLGDDTVIASLHSDHAIENEAAFRTVLDRAIDYAAEHRLFVTVAIHPTEPNTGYGYLELGEECAPGIRHLIRFVEKPDRERAVEFLATGRYAWNAGMFIWRADVFRKELQRVAPELAAVTRESYERAPAISIDYALMEKASRVVALPGDFGWSDVGSWAAVAQIAPEGNARLVTSGAENVFALTETPQRRIVVVGVSNVAVIESPNGILVLDLESAEKLSETVKSFDR